MSPFISIIIIIIISSSSSSSSSNSTSVSNRSIYSSDIDFVVFCSLLAYFISFTVFMRTL
jgi:hypothetical protein